MGRMFTVGQLAETITGGNERAMRGLLNDVIRQYGGDLLDRYAVDPSETVAREVVIDLFALRAGDRVGRKCADLLGDTMTQSGLTCGLCGATIDPADVDAHLSEHTAGLFVNVWNVRPWLALSAGVQGGRETTRHLADDDHTEALVEELTQAVEDAGGALNMSGRYYIQEVAQYPAIAQAVLHGTWED